MFNVVQLGKTYYYQSLAKDLFSLPVNEQFSSILIEIIIRNNLKQNYYRKTNNNFFKFCKQQMKISTNKEYILL
jgi:hypothetical protein